MGPWAILSFEKKRAGEGVKENKTGFSDVSFNFVNIFSCPL
jgi:hypothetical protein